ncbi:MAG TPA: dodecin [Acidimicrobiales bacterium]|nr:dodecin [Acidimicrobiales bacterium]
MAANTYSVSEIVGSSEESIEDAVRGAIARASTTVRNLDWFELVSVRGHIEDGAVRHFQATLKIGFRLDEQP